MKHIYPPVTGRAGSKAVRKCYLHLLPHEFGKRPYIHVEPYAGALGSLVQAFNAGLNPVHVIAGEKSLAMRSLIQVWQEGRSPFGTLTSEFCKAYEMGQSLKNINADLFTNPNIKRLVELLYDVCRNNPGYIQRFLRVPERESRNMRLIPQEDRGYFHNLFKVICALEYEGNVEAIALVHAVVIKGFVRRNNAGRLNVTPDPEKVSRLKRQIETPHPDSPKPWNLSLYDDADLAVKQAISFARTADIFAVLDPPYFVPLDPVAAKEKRLSGGGSLGQSYEFHNPHDDVFCASVAEQYNALTAAGIPVVLYQYCHLGLESLLSDFNRIETRMITNHATGNGVGYQEYAYLNRYAQNVVFGGLQLELAYA